VEICLDMFYYLVTEETTAMNMWVQILEKFNRMFADDAVK